jgi:tetratricopeptide (TPR) repeat protein
MTNLADIYLALGRHAEALELSRKTYDLREATLGPTHPDTIASMTNLAIALGALGRHAEALLLFEKAEALHEARLGTSHPRTLLSMYNLACIHALMMPGSADRARHADLAMGWLRRAVAGGYRDVAHMKRDSDLDALRDRKDFRDLISDLEARPAAPKK